MAVDYKKLLNKMLDVYDTPEKTLDFFIRNKEFFTKGRYKASNFDVNKNKFSSRKEDNTPSTLCKTRLTTVDFGDTGKQKGILNFIIDIYNEDADEKLELPKAFPIAVQMLADILDVDKEQNMDDYVYVPPPKVEEKKEKPYSIKYIDRQIQNFKKSDKHKKVFKELIDGLCRSCSLEEKRRAVKVFKIGLNDYISIDPKTKKSKTVYRLFIPEYSRDLIAYGSFRYNRSEEPKGLLRKNCQRILFGISLSHTFNKEKPIIFAEGHSDVIVNNSKRIQTITSGSATTPIGDNISEMKGKTYHFFYDLDLPGVKGITERIIEIEIFNAKQSNEKDKIKYKIFQWSSKIIIDNEVKDFIDYEKDQLELIEKLKKDIRKDIPLSKEELFEKVKISSWKTLSNEPKNKGYDWIDFHTEMKNHEKYKPFLNQYSY